MSYDGSLASPYQRPDDVGMVHAGMSLRDYFAGQAFQTILASNAPWPLPPNLSVFADMAYSAADAMLKERAKCTLR